MPIDADDASGVSGSHRSGRDCIWKNIDSNGQTNEHLKMAEVLKSAEWRVKLATNRP